MKTNYSIRIIIVISSPSGAGKTSVCHKLIERDKNIALSISDTTRAARDNEKDGVDYNFIKEVEFKNRIKNNSYIEYANVFGNFCLPISFINQSISSFVPKKMPLRIKA